MNILGIIGLCIVSIGLIIWLAHCISFLFLPFTGMRVTSEQLKWPFFTFYFYVCRVEFIVIGIGILIVVIAYLLWR